MMMSMNQAMADAYPISKYSNAFYTYTGRTRAYVHRTALVTTKLGVKAMKPWMICMIILNRMNGVRSGRVMMKNCLIGEAPSTLDAS